MQQGDGERAPSPSKEDGPHHGKGCPMDAILRLLMGPWTTYILWVLLNEGPIRFTTLKRAIPGISAKVLTERLRMLEAQCVVSRAYESTIPPTVTYALTERGRDLERALRAINDLALQWRAEEETPRLEPAERPACAASVDRSGQLC
jgi:DNA-binding HxlR family transcriptional regulator